jgi:hypothetical protein
VADSILQIEGDVKPIGTVLCGLWKAHLFERINDRRGLMKRIYCLVALMATLCMSGCSKPVLDWRNAEVSNGKIFETGADEAFDGLVTDVPHGKIQKLLGAAVLWSLKTNQPKGMANLLGGMDYECDVTVKDGLVADHVICRHHQSQVVAYEGQLNNGRLDGETLFHSPSGGRVVVLPMKEGRVDGRVQVYFGDSPEQLSLEADMANSTYNGELIGYHPSGKVSVKGQNSSGVPTGVWETYREEDGTVSERVMYEAGKVVSQSLYEPDGKEYLTEEQMWALHRSIASSDDFALTPEQEVLLSEAEKRYGAVRLLSPSQLEAKLQAEDAQRRADKIARGLDPDCFVCDGSDKQ